MNRSLILLKNNEDFRQYHMVSFINLYSLPILLELPKVNEKIVYFSDGWLLSKLVEIFSNIKIQRVSFDDTSLAPIIFESLIESKERIYFLGSKSNELEEFIRKKRQLYPELQIGGFHNGYFTELEKKQIFEDILRLEIDTVVMGLGSGMQEKTMYQLHEFGFKGKIYSCGGYFHQTALSKSDEYYPKWVDKLHLRAFYRCFKEPRTIKRYLLNYPVSCFSLFKALKDKKIQIR